MLDLKDMKYYSEDVGSTFKSTAHEYHWEFIIEDTKVCIQYFIYKISNIRKVVYNQKVLREEHSGKNNTYSFEFIMDGHHYKIIQAISYNTQLFIDGESFDFIYTLERNKKEFEGNKFGRVDNIYNKRDDNEIQSSNEINFIKQDKSKQILNLSIGIKNENNIDNKENKLRKFKFGNDENIAINKKENNINKNPNNNNNLIDLDSYNNTNNINKFEKENRINIINNVNILNMQNDFNKFDNNNFNINYGYNGYNNYNQQNLKQNNNINNCNYNINKIRNLSNDYFFEKDNQNDNNYDIQNQNNNYKLNITQNERGNDLNNNNMNFINTNNFKNNIMINDQENRPKDHNNIDIAYYGF